jgi:hypothetical protein
MLSVYLTDEKSKAQTDILMDPSHTMWIELETWVFILGLVTMKRKRKTFAVCHFNITLNMTNQRQSSLFRN